MVKLNGGNASWLSDQSGCSSPSIIVTGNSPRLAVPVIVAVEFVVARLALSRFRLMLVRLRAVLDGTQILFAPLSRIEGRKEK